MSAPVIGMFVGILLAFAAILNGFSGFVLAVVFGGLGYVIVGQVTGQLDVVGMIRSRSRG